MSDCPERTEMLMAQVIERFEIKSDNAKEAIKFLVDKFVDADYRANEWREQAKFNMTRP